MENFVAFCIMSAIPLALIAVLIVKIRQWRKDRELLRTVTDTWRGTRSERRLILSLLKMGFPPVTLYHDLYVEKSHDRYAQIDAVMLTKVGIIVFEVKEYSGWIFGKGYYDYWTQTLARGREKHRFYNPIKQNEGHINVLANRLRNVADVPFYSVVVFYGNCEFRDVSYSGRNSYVCYSWQLHSVLHEIQDINANARYADKRGLIKILERAVRNGADKEIVKQHIRNIRSSH